LEPALALGLIGVKGWDGLDDLNVLLPIKTRSLFNGDAGVGSLKLEELEVKRLRVGEPIISDSLVTPSDDRTAS
jgi:hypothetical protein